MTKERLQIIVENLIDHLDESLGRNRKDLHKALTLGIGMNDDEVNELCGDLTETDDLIRENSIVYDFYDEAVLKYDVITPYAKLYYGNSKDKKMLYIGKLSNDMYKWFDFVGESDDEYNTKEEAYIGFCEYIYDADIIVDIIKL